MMPPTVPSPSDIVHDVVLFLLNPPHPEAVGREVWERARVTIANLATGPTAAPTAAPKPASNVVELAGYRTAPTRPDDDRAA